MKTTLTRLFGVGSTPNDLTQQISKAKARQAELEQALAAADDDLETALGDRREALLAGSDAATAKKCESAVLAARSKRDGIADAITHLAEQITALDGRLVEARAAEERGAKATEIENQLDVYAAAKRELDQVIGPVAAILNKLASTDATVLELPIAGGGRATSAHIAQTLLVEALERAAPSSVGWIDVGPHAKGRGFFRLRFDPRHRVLSGASEKLPPFNDREWKERLGSLDDLVASERDRARRIRAGEAAPKPGKDKVVPLAIAKPDPEAA